MGISRQQALDCFRSDDLIGIGMEADAVRRSLHPESVVSYANLGPVTLGVDALAEAARAVKLGASGLLLRGGDELGLAGTAAAIFALRSRYPALTLHGLDARTLLRLGPLEDTLARLAGSGLDSILGESAGIATAEWIGVHRAAHLRGMRTTATLLFGAGESFEQRADRLEAIAALQQETGGFIAFTPETWRSGGRTLDETTAVESLKTLAICRMFLNSIPNVETSWAAEGLKVLQLGLRFGANDVGSVLPPVVSAEGETPATEEDLRRIVRDAGFEPVERDALYRTMFLV